MPGTGHEGVEEVSDLNQIHDVCDLKAFFLNWEETWQGLLEKNFF